MAEVELKVGARLDLLNQRELDQSLGKYMARSPYQAVSLVRMPLLIATGANPLTMGGDSGTVLHTPDQGYGWTVRHLVIEGMTTGATPDVMNILRNGRIIWQLNGNQFAQTWGRGEIILMPGETLQYQSVGTFNATGRIIIHGASWQVPTELLAELVT